jgi:hypothetical protein
MIRSSQAHPCPVCGRTKDGDCRVSEDGNLVLCHRNFGDICPPGWRYVKPANDDRTGVFVRDYPKTDRPWGKTFKHPYKSFQGTTHTQVRTYKTDKTGKICKWDKPLGEIKESDLLPYQWDKVKDSPEIFLVEGELCADALLDRGLPATCVRSWGDKQAELFAGKTVVLLPDCDREGIKKAGKARDLLSAHNATIRWCYLPRIGNWEYPKPKDGLDSYDYFQLGGTVSELRSAITEKEITPKAKDKPQPNTEGGGKSPKVFDLLMTIVSELHLFKEDNELGDTYADVTIDGVRRTYKVRSSEFKAWLTGELYRRFEKPANSEAMETCLKICEAQSMTTIGKVWFKTATHDGKVYLDLCNDRWQAIEVSKDGWRVVDSVDLPVRFIRSPVQRELPIPENYTKLENYTKTTQLETAPRAKNVVNVVNVVNSQSKSSKENRLNKLWELLPFAPESQPLVIAWLLSCLVPTGEKPILVLSAPKGSGKSTIARFLVNLIDATKADLLPSVGDRRALAVQSRHRWIFAYDNLTYLSVEQQDALCCTSTGAGYMERKLFTDDDVTFVEYRRPQILTSVDLVPTRSDLLDRCLLVKLTPIPEGDRKTAEELEALFTASRSEILGALLDLLSVALGNLDSVNQPLQRMASFHKLGLAAKIPGFDQAYLASISDSKDEAVRANPISDAIAEMGNFEGTTQELVQKLKDISDDPKVQKLTTRALGRFLNGSLKSDLESIGIRIDSFRSAKCMNWIISRTDTDIDAKKTTLTTLTTEPAPRQDSSCVVIDRANYSNYTNYTKTTQEGEGDSRAGRADTPPTTSINGGGTRKICVGDRVRYVGREHWQVCGDRVLTVKAIEGGNAIVTYPKWWLDKTIPIADLELVVGQCAPP